MQEHLQEGTRDAGIPAINTTGEMERQNRAPQEQYDCHPKAMLRDLGTSDETVYGFLSLEAILAPHLPGVSGSARRPTTLDCTGGSSCRPRSSIVLVTRRH